MAKRNTIPAEIPPLGWGKEKECTFIAALEAALAALGRETDYVDLMGMSAAAFRISLHDQWCPSSPDMFPRDEAALHAGWKLREMGMAGGKTEDPTKAQASMRKTIEAEIDGGRPVIAIDLVSVPDWGVIAGYDGEELLCRTYYDEQAPKRDGLVAAQKFPWIIFTLQKADSVPSRRKSVAKALKLAGDQFHLERHPFGPYANGRAAFDKWAEDLRNEGMFAAMVEEGRKTPEGGSLYRHYWHSNGWIYDSLMDARKAAQRFLERHADALDGKKKHVEDAAALFAEVSSMLWENWIHFPMPFWVREKEGKIWIPGDRFIEGTEWTPEMRARGAEALRKVSAIEEEAHRHLADAVARSGAI